VIFQEFRTDDRLTDNNNLDDVYVRNERERDSDWEMKRGKAAAVAVVVVVVINSLRPFNNELLCLTVST